MKNLCSIITLAIVLFLITNSLALAQVSPNGKINIDPNLPWSERMILSEMKRLQQRNKNNEIKVAKRWGYVSGLVLPALNDVANHTGKEEYYQLSEDYADMMVRDDGTITNYKLESYNIDYISPANVFFYVYEKTGEERYKKALDLVRSQLDNHPRVYCGGFWHKQIYTNQMWLDGLYMGSPFYAHYEKLYGDGSKFEDVARQFIVMEQHAHDPETGLLYHGWDSAAKMFWADPITGLSKNFWSRGMGWYAMGVVDALDYFPEDHPRRDDLIAILQRLADALSKVQDSSGVWYQVLNLPGREGNYLEATGSNMFTYAILKGIHKDYLDTSYLDMMAKAWKGIHAEFITIDEDDHELHMDHSCGTAGLGGKVRKDGTYDKRRDGTFEYYISEKIRYDDDKATGPFILAALEIETMNEWLPKRLAAKTALFTLK